MSHASALFCFAMRKLGKCSKTEIQCNSLWKVIPHGTPFSKPTTRAMCTRFGSVAGQTGCMRLIGSSYSLFSYLSPVDFLFSETFYVTQPHGHERGIMNLSALTYLKPYYSLVSFLVFFSSVDHKSYTTLSNILNINNNEALMDG